MNKILKHQHYIAIILVVFAVISRWLPHPPNVAPITAIALFGAVHLDKRLAFTLPLLSLVLSDLLLGFYGSTMFFVYGSFLLTSVIGYLVKKKSSFLAVSGAAIASSVLFFLITNFGVWVAGEMYSKDWAGLTSCYVAALPFFRNTLLGDLFYTTVIFGLYRVIGGYSQLNVRNRTAELVPVSTEMHSTVRL